MFFEVNGIPRVIEIEDQKLAQVASGNRALRERADLTILGSVPAPMAGEIIEITAKPGAVPSASSDF